MAFLEIMERDLAGPRTRMEAHKARIDRQARLKAAGRENAAAKRREAEFLRNQAAEQARIAFEEERVKLESVVADAGNTFRPRWREIAAEVCLKHGLTFEAVAGSCRLAHFVRARQELMYRLYDELHWSYPEIGRRLGGRDHTTALLGVRKHASLNGLPNPSRPASIHPKPIWMRGQSADSEARA